MKRKTMKIGMVAFAILLATTLVSAGLLTYFGQVQTTANVEQSVKIDNGNWDNLIEHTINGVGGCCYCFPHTVKNNGCKDIDLSWSTTGLTEGLELKVYEKCHLETLELNILDGIADDSFTVLVDGVLVYTYTNGDPIIDTEAWHVHSIDLDDYKFYCDTIHTVTIEATGPAWDYHGTYGQLAVGYITMTNALGVSQTINIGDIVSEATHNLKGWGPIEPATHPGGWGGATACRVVWYDSEPRWATVDFEFDCACACADGSCDGHGVPIDGLTDFKLLSGQTQQFCFVYELDMLLAPGTFNVNTYLVPK